jgi:hypothetical protein
MASDATREIVNTASATWLREAATVEEMHSA